MNVDGETTEDLDVDWDEAIDDACEAGDDLAIAMHEPDDADDTPL